MNNAPLDPTKRQLLAGTAAAAAVLATSNLAQAEHVSHNSHSHHKTADTSLIDAANHCAQAGEACLSHCIELVGHKDTSIAGCMHSVAETTEVCSTCAKLVTMQSKHVKSFAKICADACEDCEKECRKHAKKHHECKDCADSCVAMLKKYKELTA